MGYQRGDNRFGGGDDRWRDENRGGGYGGRDRGGHDGDRHGHEGGGFFERARSWFSDDDHDRGRERGGQGYQRDRDYGPAERMTGWGGDDAGGGWGNQRSGGGGWGNEGSGGGGRGYGRGEGYGGRENQARHSYGDQNYSGQGSRDRDFGRGQGSGGGGGGGYSGSMAGGSDAADTWGGSGFGGLDDNGRRFDRIDAGHTGTQGAHPMSSPVDGGYGGYGASSQGFGSSARSAAIMAQARGGGAQHHDYSKVLGDRPQQQQRGGGMHDHHYSQWRERQISDLDRDYDEYRREHQSKFEQEFHGWREKRQGQRQSIRKAAPQMEVIGSDGQHIGTVDKVAGDRIILTKNDENAGGHHHSIPCSWIESVDERVTVNKSAQEAMNAWRDEEHNRALFERESQGSEGPHILNRSFSGTYDEGQR